METIKKAIGLSSLPTRPLGRNGPSVTALGLGLMGLSVAYGPAPPENERFAFLDKAHELGDWFWDSADLYGDNEILLGNWFKANPDKRSNIFLATKFGITKEGPNSSPEYAKLAFEKSLGRLGLDYIDLWYCHRVDGKTPIEQTVRAMDEFRKAGRVKYLGLSEVSAETLRRACKVAPISCVQMEYSPFALEIESPQYNLLKTARELGVAIIAYSPLGRGLLTGTIRSPADFSDEDFRKLVPRYSEENFPKNLKLVDGIDALAKAKGVTSGQLTLAWLMKQGNDIIPIPGTTKVKRLEENLAALKIDLSQDEEQKIRNLCEKAEYGGGRYPEALSSCLFGDTPAE